MSEFPKGWVETSLGEVVSLAQGVAINAKTNYVLCEKEEGLPLLKINNLLNNTVDQYANPDLVGIKTIIDKEDIIFTRTGQVGWVFTGKVGILHNNSFKVMPSNNINKKFLFWFLKQNKVYKYVQKVASGSAQPDLNHDAFKTIVIKYPPLPEQKSIAKLLSSFDEKIELLEAQNETLETLAQTIFKEWFVNFNYPGSGAVIDSELGEIPEGWRVGSLIEVFDLIGGGTPKTSIDEYWNGGIPWYSVVDAPKGYDTFIIDTEKNISALGLEKSSTKLLRTGTTIVSARGTVGKLALVGRETTMNQSCYGIQGKEYFSDYYVYYQVKQALDILKRRVHGAVFDTITQETFRHIEVPVPTKNVVADFENIVKPIMDKILNNVLQIQTLKTTRDILLPKLMSGAVRVKGFGK